MENGIRIFTQGCDDKWIRITADGVNNDENWQRMYKGEEKLIERIPGSYNVEIASNYGSFRPEYEGRKTLSVIYSPGVYFLQDCGFQNKCDIDQSYAELLKDSCDEGFVSTKNFFDPKNFNEAKKIREIKVENNYNKTVYFRVSGYGGGSEDWVAVKPGEKGSIKRNFRYKNRLEYSSMPIPTTGKVFWVSAGDSFQVDEKFEFYHYDFNGNLNERKPKDRLFRSVMHDKYYKGEGKNETPFKPFSSYKLHASQNEILLINATGKEITARLGFWNNDNIDYIKINPNGGHHFWNRYGSYYLVDIHYDGFICRYRLGNHYAGGSYVFYPTKTLTDACNMIVEFCKEKWDAKEDDEYVIKINDKNYVGKKDRKIDFYNDSSEKIWIRVKAKDIGSEDLFPVEPGTSYSFKETVEIIMQKLSLMKIKDLNI